MPNLRTPALPALARLAILSLLGLLVIGGRCMAQETRVLTPDESVRLGLERNALVRAAEADAREAEAVYRQARAARLPSLATQASYSRISDNIPEISFTPPGSDVEVTLAPVVLDRYYTEVSVEQPLFTGLRIHHQIQAASHQAEAAALDAANQEAEVAYRIRQAYWQLYQAEALREATAASLARVDAYLADVRNRRDAGAALESEVLSAQTRRSEVMLEQVQADNDLRVARLELNHLLGLSPGTLVEPAADVAVAPVADDLAALVARAADGNPQLNALVERVGALDAQVSATMGGWFPEVVLSGRYAYARPNQFFFLDQDVFRGNWEAGLALRWSLWNGGQRSGQTQEARARLQSAEARLTYARDQLTVDVTRQYLEVQRALETVQVLAQNVAEAEEAFRVVRQQFDAGAALAATVLDAEEALRLAQSRQAQARAGYAVARAGLLFTLGSIW